MTCSPPPRVAPVQPEADRPRPGAERVRTEHADRAFDEGVRWFLAVSRRAAFQSP